MRIAQLLTARERDVVVLLGMGKTSKEIALALHISVGTVGNHRKSLCRKWRVHSTAELVQRATGMILFSTKDSRCDWTGGSGAQDNPEEWRGRGRLQVAV